MGSNPCSQGFLLFLLLQMSLPLCVRAQETTMAGSDMNTATNGATFTATSYDQISSSAVPTPAMSTVMTMANFTSNDTTSANYTVPTSGPGRTNASMLFCRRLTCNSTACYSLFMNTNATLCPPSHRFCELRREDPMRYSVNCATICPTFCNNTSQTNCSVDCCGSETCLNITISNLVNSTMSMTSTTLATTTNTTTKATTAVTTTAVTNGKKCHKLSCNGDTCYQGNTNVVLCSTQNYCMLKKTTSASVVSWTGGCSDDCSKETVCTSSTATCFLECCNATTTASCLKLTGVVNMPNSATRGLISPVLLVASSLLLWFMSNASSA